MARTLVASDTFTDASAPQSLSTYNSSWVNSRPAACLLNTKAGGTIYDLNGYMGDPWYYWNDTFTDDQYAQIAFDTVWTGTVLHGVTLQCSTDTASNTRDAYLITVGHNSVNYTVKIYKVADGAFGSVLNNGGSGDTISLTAGDTISAELVSGTINVYKNWTGSGDTPVATYTDGSPRTGGRPGVYTTATGSAAGLITSWEGGNVTAGASAVAGISRHYARMMTG